MTCPVWGNAGAVREKSYQVMSNCFIGIIRVARSCARAGLHRATVVASIGEMVFLSETSMTSAGLIVSHFIEADFAR